MPQPSQSESAANDVHGPAESPVSENTLAALVALAWPVLIEQTLGILVGYSDWFITGRYLDGVSPKAAMGLMVYMLWLIPTIFSAVAIGATAIVARCIGRGDPREASHTANQALVTGAAFALIVTPTAYLGAGWFVRAAQLPEEAAALAEQYLQIVALAIPATMAERIGAACLRGAGDTVTGFLAKTLVVVVNIAVSFSLVQGLFGLPKLGWAGLAWGTAAGHTVAAAVMLGVLLVGRRGLQLQLPDMRPHWTLMGRLLRVGLPGGLDLTGLVLCHLVYVSIINRLGTDAAAAHGLAVNIEALAYLPGSAFQVAAASLTGQYLGAGRPDLARRSALQSTAAAALLMSAAGTLFLLAPGWLTMIFTGDRNDPTGTQAAELLRIVSFSMPFLATVMVLSGSLRGAGDTAWPMVFTLVGFLLIRIPGAYLLTHQPLDDGWIGWDLGVYGAWYAMVADILLRCGMVVARFWEGGWQKVEV